MVSRRSAARFARISGPGELLQAVPYLLGFQPARSLVLVGLAGERLVVTARLDLGDALRGGVPHAVAAMTRGGSTAFVAVIYDDEALRDEDSRLPWGALAADVECDVEDVGCDLRDVLLVSRGRWWSVSCTDAYCCPFDGRELPDAPSSFTAAATVDGVVVLPNRAALQEVLAPVPDAERYSLEPAIADAEHRAVQQTIDGHARRWELSVKRRLFRVAREADEPGWPGTSDDVAARFGAALRVTPLRDAVWLAIDNDRLDGRPLWRDLGRRLPSPYDAPPLFLYGWASWRAGDGASAAMAVERALTGDPNYSAADLLMAAISAGTDPRQVPKLRLPRASGARARPRAAAPGGAAR